MRPTRIALPLLALAALGLLAAPAVLADGEGGADTAADAKGKAAGKRAAAAETADDGNGTKRPAHVAALVERMAALRASWHEGATKVREDCRAQALDDNATKEERLAYAHCIRDGYRELRAAHHADIRAARADWKAALDAWKESRRAERAAADADA